MTAISSDSNSDSDKNKNKNKDNVILSALCEHEKEAEHHINRKDFHVAWRDENLY
jgi:hypothetical protein